MRRVFTVLLALSLIAGFTTPRLQAASERGSEASPAEFDPAADVEGRGIISAVGCAGCLGGGVLIISSGAGSLLSAAGARGSALAAVTCIAICKDAIASAW